MNIFILAIATHKFVITFCIGLELVGDAVGLKEPGTILHHPLSEVEVTCLASEIPNSIRVDVRELAVKPFGG